MRAPSSHLRRVERTRRRSHELRADRIGDRVPQDGLDPRFDIWAQMPPDNVVDGSNLVGAPSAPKRNGDALIENPADRESEYALAVARSCQPIERFDRCEVLLESRRLELRVNPTQVVAGERRFRSHAPGQQPAAQCPVREGGNALATAVRQHVAFDATLEQVVGRLHHMQRRSPSELLDLFDREIAHADRPNLPLPKERVHDFGGLVDRYQRIGPVNLIDVDVIGLQSPQRVLYFTQDPRSTRFPKNFVAGPLEADLRGHDDVRPDALQGFADDLFRPAEPIDGRGIDHIDPVIERLADRGDRLLLVSAAPHPSADSPGAHRDSRDLQRGAGDFRELHLRLEVLYPMYMLLLLSTRT